MGCCLPGRAREGGIASKFSFRPYVKPFADSLGWALLAAEKCTMGRGESESGLHRIAIVKSFRRDR